MLFTTIYKNNTVKINMPQFLKPKNQKIVNLSFKLKIRV